jgi:hypothetical protein
MTPVQPSSTSLNVQYTSLSELSPEILTLIFLKLSNEDLDQIKKVCRKFYAITLIKIVNIHKINDLYKTQKNMYLHEYDKRYKTSRPSEIKTAYNFYAKNTKLVGIESSPEQIATAVNKLRKADAIFQEYVREKDASYCMDMCMCSIGFVGISASYCGGFCCLSISLIYNSMRYGVCDPCYKPNNDDLLLSSS